MDVKVYENDSSETECEAVRITEGKTKLVFQKQVKMPGNNQSEVQRNAEATNHAFFVHRQERPQKTRMDYF